MRFRSHRPMREKIAINLCFCQLVFVVINMHAGECQDRPHVELWTSLTDQNVYFQNPPNIEEKNKT